MTGQREVGMPMLQSFLDAFPDQLPRPPELAALDAEARTALYERVLAEAEQRLWHAAPTAFDTQLAHYQALTREYQSHLDATNPTQHRLLLAITVADRPAHVRACLHSILRQFELYGYGGRDANGRAAKLTVILAEDSREPRHRDAHRALADEFCSRGLTVLHYDLPEQFALLQAIPAAQRQQLARLLTDQPAERFWRKGQAANRNLAYLKFLQLTEDKAGTLYYLVDSDQTFEVNLAGADGERVAMPFSYFHLIDRIFREHDIRVLTGKLVGDPPVSPAVMAANFLDDVTAFLHRIADCEPHAACSFHPQDAPLAGEAAYHDLANRFGFAPETRTFDYRCPLEGTHDHAACLNGFSERLHGFFFGEHPTRRTGFRYDGALTTLTPARTIYPGNTIVNFDGLKYIIPFGHLRLRMSGPTAGRLIQAEIGARFASANLPMLHRRTLADCQAEFRPGVEQQDDAAIDISDEFERQFFGDVMLFSVVAWLNDHPLDALRDDARLESVVMRVEAELLADYTEKHQAVRARHAALDRWLAARPDWPSPLVHARIAQFLRNVAANFGGSAPAWQLILSATHRQQRRQQIIDALRQYRSERAAWDQLFNQ